MTITDRAGNITVRVPGDYSSPVDAFDFLRTETLTGNITGTITVDPGKYFFDTDFLANHPQGANIRIDGESTDVIFEWNNAGATSGISVNKGHTLGRISNIIIQLPTKAAGPPTNNGIGLLASDGGTIICGSNMVVKNFYFGIAARWTSYIFADRAHVSDAGDSGFFSFMNSMIRCQNAISIDISNPTLGFGSGFLAENGAAMDCAGSSASGCLYAGFGALSVSSMRAANTSSKDNTGDGYRSWQNSYIDATNSTASGNGGIDYNSTQGGIIIT